MKINGSYVELAKEMTLAKLLENQGYNWMRVAVERNGSIVPKSEFDSVFLSEADELEIVSFVGGG